MMIWLYIGIAVWWVLGMVGFYLDFNRSCDITIGVLPLWVFSGVTGIVGLFIGFAEVGIKTPVLFKARKPRY